MTEPINPSIDELKLGYKNRQNVPDELRSWTIDYPDYSPLDYTSETVLTRGVEHGWADPVDPTQVDFSHRPSFVGNILFDQTTGRPLNPRGRQGLQGRGDLGKWGVNNAADPIVITINCLRLGLVHFESICRG